MSSSPKPRRGFLQGVLAAGAMAGLPPRAVEAQAPAGEFGFLPPYARAMTHRSLKQSSFDRSGGNRDRWTVAGRPNFFP